ncbi:DUF2007 domain-containing protein [Methylopila sp. M107]|uniref:putative signal transducing protein n=1 Tax=Methylopila sp. M107 TaxID=1101190 RepID=UPI000368987D|nr:DUF2007 domain-containing protein [Methylopila sp. M107]
MHEILRSNDPVLLSFARSTLEGEGVECFVLDGNMSVLEGSLGILASRMLVTEDDAPRARRLLIESGLSHELRPEPE